MLILVGLSLSPPSGRVLSKVFIKGMCFLSRYSAVNALRNLAYRKLKFISTHKNKMSHISALAFCVFVICCFMSVSTSSVKRSDKTDVGDVEEMSEQKLMIYRLMHRLLDAVEETYKDLGASEEELSAMKKKRGHVTACYFSSITCY